MNALAGLARAQRDGLTGCGLWTRPGRMTVAHRPAGRRCATGSIATTSSSSFRLCARPLGKAQFAREAQLIGLIPRDPAAVRSDQSADRVHP
jgi:hypothetical protein